MTLSKYFSLSETIEATHKWSLLCQEEGSFSIGQLATELADYIMKQRCIGCPALYIAWRDKVTKGTDLPKQSQKALTAFIRPVFGTPDEPDNVPVDHIEGYIGQMIWYFIIQEVSPETIVRLEPPSFKATDHGGDGFIVHCSSDGSELFFRLWEIKKFVKRHEDSSSNISSTVNAAYTQLKENATEYLARYTAVGQEIGEPELKMFYSKLIDYWIDSMPQASVGISIATSEDQIPQRCFSTFGDQFPELTIHKRLLGMMTAIGDFENFCVQVKECIWKGL